jgi:hypothetical protein
MRTAFVIGLVALIGHPVLSAAQATPPPSPASKWSAEFSGLTDLDGAAALLATSPHTAWRFGGTLTLSGNSHPGYQERIVRSDLAGGQRWSSPRHGRVQAFTGLGATGSYARIRISASPFEQRARVYQIGAYGELGGQIFITDEIGLGVRWSAAITFDHQRFDGNYLPNPYFNDQIRVRGGDVRFFGTLRL